MPVTLTSPAEGLRVGDTYRGEREDWLVDNGYAARAGDFDGLHATSVDAKDDPTLAANREAPPVQGGDVDAVQAEDGEAILAARQLDEDLDPRLEVAPQARLVPAGLEDTDARIHGTGVLLDGSEYDEDKLAAKLSARSSRRAAERAQDDPVLEVAPQADPRQRHELAKEIEKESKAVAKRSEKVRDRAEFDIPETSANVGEREPAVVQDEENTHRAADDAERTEE
jgi:hypothetical protein